MNKASKNIPVYSLNEFQKSGKDKSILFQVEVFDANRHFSVSYPHKHDFYEVLFLSKGSGYHIIDSNKYKIKPPCVFFLSPGQAHRLELSFDIEGYIFLFTAEYYLLNNKSRNRLLEFPFFYSVDRENPPLYLTTPEDIIFIESLFKKGCKELEKGEKYSNEIIRTLLELILLSLDQLYPEDLITINRSRGHITVKKFLLLIEENYQKNLSVNKYAEMLAITPNHLTQLVKQITGKTSIELLQEKIIVETKRLLVHSNMTVSEIADLFQFEDQSYFTKYFKKKAGMTPLQYRKKSMKNT